MAGRPRRVARNPPTKASASATLIVAIRAVSCGIGVPLSPREPMRQDEQDRRGDFLYPVDPVQDHAQTCARITTGLLRAGPGLATITSSAPVLVPCSSSAGSRFSSRTSHENSSKLALKIELYVPKAMPTKIASTKL